MNLEFHTGDPLYPGNLQSDHDQIKFWWGFPLLGTKAVIKSHEQKSQFDLQVNFLSSKGSIRGIKDISLVFFTPVQLVEGLELVFFL